MGRYVKGATEYFGCRLALVFIVWRLSVIEDSHNYMYLSSYRSDRKFYILCFWLLNYKDLF